MSHTGDFFVHFMDIADEELSKPINKITTPKLHSLLELAIRTSKAISGRGGWVYIYFFVCHAYVMCVSCACHVCARVEV